MTIAISNDLRERIVDRYLSTNESYDLVAEHFAVGRATVNRIVNRFRRTGTVDPAPPGGGNPPCISDDQLPRLRELVAEKPDRGIEALASEWRRRFGKSISRSSMGRALMRAQLTRKKSHSTRRSMTGPTSKKSGKRTGTKPPSSRPGG